MNFNDIIKNKEKCIQITNISSGEFEEFLDYYFDRFYDFNLTEEFSKKVTGIWIERWYCTDTWVGVKLYFYEDIPILLSIKTAKKNDEEYKIFDKESYNKFIEFLLTFKEEEIKLPEEISLFEDIGDGYKLAYSEQILQKTAIYIQTGEKVEIINKYWKYKDIDSWQKVDILINGEIRQIDMDDLLFEFGT